MKKIYFANLDALRSIAALFVMMSHILYEYIVLYFPDSLMLKSAVFNFFLFNGGFGVQIFFALSGFLITYLLLSEMKQTGELNLFNFYVRRVLRIWPVYFIVVGFVFIVYQSVKHWMNYDSEIYESAWMSVLFLSNFDLIRILSNEEMYSNGILALTWSVSVEEQFYLVWPLLFVMVGFRKIKYVIISILIISTIFMVYAQNDITLIYHHTVSNFIFLGTGACVAYLQVYEHWSLKYFAKLSKLQWLLIMSFQIVLLIFTKDKLIHSNYGMLVYSIIVASFLFVLLLNQTSKVKRPIELGNYKFLLNIAKYTYGLYMYHRIAGFILSTTTYKLLKLDQSFTLASIVMILQFMLTFLMAFLSYKYIEKPILKYKHKFSIFSK